MAKTLRTAKQTTSIPRTHKAAQKRGFGKADFKFADLNKNQKKNFMQLEGGASGSICGVAPSPDPSYWLVCYKGENGQCNWVHVPKGQAPQVHE